MAGVARFTRLHVYKCLKGAEPHSGRTTPVNLFHTKDLAPDDKPGCTRDAYQLLPPAGEPPSTSR